MVLWDTELEETLLKKMNKNLELEIQIDLQYYNLQID